MCIFSLLYTVLKISSISYPYQCLFWHGTGKNFLKVSGMLVIMFVFHCLTFIGVEIEIKIQIWRLAQLYRNLLGAVFEDKLFCKLRL